MNRLKNLSIYHKVLTVTVSTVLLLGGFLAYITLEALNEMNDRQIEKRGVEMAGHVASIVAAPILVNDIYSLGEFIHEFRSDTEDLRYLLVFDHTGRLLAHTFPVSLPKGLRNVNPIPLRTESRIIALDSDEGAIRDILVPIENGAIGYVRAGITEEPSKTLIGNTTKSLLAITVAFCSLAAMLGILLARFITAPVGHLVSAAQAIAAGNLDARAEVRTGDEIGGLAASFNEMAQELKAKDQLRATLLNKVISAQEEERKRISRELHDETGQALTSLIVSMRVLANKAADEKQRELLLSAREVAAGILLDIRNMAVELRPTALDDLGLTAAVRKYVANFQERFGIRIGFQVDSGINELAGDLSVTLYRIVQESLANAARHSGASAIDISLEMQPGQVLLRIADNGQGMPDGELERAARANRLGIYGMRERVELYGGEFQLESQVGAGTTILVTIPLKNKGDSHGS